MTTEQLVTELIVMTTEAIQKMYCGNEIDYGIIPPPYSNRENKQSRKRRCEQELRFVFVEQFLSYRAKHADLKNWHYSVETPTYFKYTSAWKGNPAIEGSSRRSGKIDLTLYENENPMAFIEFKYGSLGEYNKNLEYDVIKLIAETAHYEKTNGIICHGYSLNLVEKENDSLDKDIFDVYIDTAIGKIKNSCKELENLGSPEAITVIKSRIQYQPIVLLNKS